MINKNPWAQKKAAGVMHRLSVPISMPMYRKMNKHRHKLFKCYMSNKSFIDKIDITYGETP